MLSSVVDDKPAASTWLDRLRLSRGISTTEDDDASGNPLSLDDFLRRNQHTEITGVPATTSASDSPPSAPTPSDPELAESPLEPGAGEWYGVMSDVLSELFNFGGSSRSSIPGKKFPRKQSNPRHCSIETHEDIPLLNQKRDANRLPTVRQFETSSRNSHNKKPASDRKERRRTIAEADGVDEEEKEGEKDLIGFSRSEVTVIDTSFSIWKSEKLVFRRKNVWKVKEKKGKSRVVPLKKKTLKKKKRKFNVDDGEIARKSKKKKMKIVSRSPPTPQYQSKEVRGDPENSSVIRNSRLRKEGSFGLQAGKKNNKPEARDYHQPLA